MLVTLACYSSLTSHDLTNYLTFIKTILTFFQIAELSSEFNVNSYAHLNQIFIEKLAVSNSKSLSFS